MYFDWDLDKAERNLEQAIAGNPNYATAYDWLGVLFTASKRFAAAQSAFERARRLDPASLPIRTDLAFQLHYSGRNEDARQELQNILRVDPNFPLAHFWMGRVLSSEANCPGALSELETASVIVPARLAARDRRSRPHSGCLRPTIAGARRSAAV